MTYGFPELLVPANITAPPRAEVGVQEAATVGGGQSRVEGREKQRSQVLDQPSPGHGTALLGTVQVDQMELDRLARLPLVERLSGDEKVIDVEIAVVDSGPVHAVHHTGNLVNQRMLERHPTVPLDRHPAWLEVFQCFPVFQCFQHHKRLDRMRVASPLPLAEDFRHGDPGCGERLCCLPFGAGADHRFAQAIPFLEDFLPAAAQVALDENVMSAQPDLIGQPVFDLPVREPLRLKKPIKGVFSYWQGLADAGIEFEVHWAVSGKLNLFWLSL